MSSTSAQCWFCMNEPLQALANGKNACLVSSLSLSFSLVNTFCHRPNSTLENKTMFYGIKCTYTNHSIFL